MQQQQEAHTAQVSKVAQATALAQEQAAIAAQAMQSQAQALKMQGYDSASIQAAMVNPEAAGEEGEAMAALVATDPETVAMQSAMYMQYMVQMQQIMAGCTEDTQEDVIEKEIVHSTPEVCCTK